MLYLIYKTTNLVNNKYYIGKHQTSNIHDDYLGSGIALKSAIKKYGRSLFSKEILFVFDNIVDMNAKEIELVNEEVVSSKLTYNRGVGGEGGAHFKNKKHSTETKNAISVKVKGFKHTSDAKLKISEANRRRTLSAETKLKLSAIANTRWAKEKIYRGVVEIGISLGS